MAKKSGLISYNLCFLILCLVNSIMYSQEIPEAKSQPTFSPFEGTVYSMPDRFARKGKNGREINLGIQEYYSDTIYSYPKLGEIKLDEINVPESKTKTDNFPGVDKKTKFAMILYSKMNIAVDGCYEFTLSSDDGSRLWIEDEQIINNDGGHQLRTKKDTVGLTKGTYNIKLWYFQGLPTRFGFMMDSKFIGKLENCTLKQNDQKEIETVIILDNILFQNDTYDINKEGMEELEKAVKKIREKAPKSIRIIGHTDNTGNEEYNNALSIKRAESIKNALAKLLEDSAIELIATGKGSSVPIASNKTEEGRKLNRRVELIFD